MTEAIFLPGIIAPAEVRYAPLLAHLDDINAVPRNLAVYADDEPPTNYGIGTEIAGIEAAADREGFARFHLYGQSAGGACALAYAAAYPERVLSLTLDEPATDFSDEDRTDPIYDEIAAAQELPESEALGVFLRLQLAPGVEPPQPPAGAPPPWMAIRPAGMRAFLDAIARYRVDAARYEAYDHPVLDTHGSLSNPRWAVMRDRLAGRFTDFSAKLFEGLGACRRPERVRARPPSPTRARAWTSAT